MVKSNDSVLVLVQQTAFSSDPFTDLPAHVALASSFLFWMHSDFVNNDNMAFYFVNLILNPGYFTASDAKIARKLFVCETTVRKYRKAFKLLFLEYYSEYQNLPEDDLLNGLPFLHSRLRHRLSVPTPYLNPKESLSVRRSIHLPSPHSEWRKALRSLRGSL